MVKGVVTLRVVIKLFASLRIGRFKMEEWNMPEGITVLAALNLLELHLSDVSIVRVNGKAVSDDYILQDSDQLALFPPMGGG